MFSDLNSPKQSSHVVFRWYLQCVASAFGE